MIYLYEMSLRLTLASILMASGLLALFFPVLPATLVSQAETISGIELAVNLPRDLKLSSVGEDVRELQKFLNKAGLIVSTNGPGSPGNETTFFGEATSRAVVRYQERHAEDLGLTRGTGFVDPTTRALINKTTLIINTVSVPVSAYPSVVFAQDLRFGSSNNDVKRLQDALINENLLGNTSATGYFGPLTLRAVVAYQGRHSLPMTGFVGPLTRAKLNETMVARDTQTSGIAEQVGQGGVSQSNDNLVYLPAQTSTAPAVTVGSDAGASSADNSSSASTISGSGSSSSGSPSPSPVSTPAPVPAATNVFYISPSGSDANGGASSSAPFKTFLKAWSVLQPGSTLILKDGTYTEALNPTVSGTAGNPITIKAENDGRAIIDGQNAHAGITLNARQYITLEGLLSINPGEAPALNVGATDGDFTSSHDITIRRTGIRGGMNLNNGAAASIARTRNSLLEDVWVYGYGRYALNVYGSQNITVRRAVIRWDRWDGTNYKPCDPRYNLGVYDTHDSTFENILLIDGGTASCGDHGGLYVPGNNNGNTSPYVNSSNNKFYAVIALNNRGNGLQVEGGSGGTNDNNSFQDVVSWGNDTGISVNKAVNTIFNHATIAKNNTNGSWTGAAITVSNSLITGNPGRGLNGIIASNYNNVFGNGTNYVYVSAGAQDISSDPNIKYITRLEDGAVGKGTGNDGGDRGATVLHQYSAGVLTSNSMWPWPNEERIRQDMCDSTFLTAVGRTGTNDAKWCTSGKSLTRYIWEAAGSTMPSSLYSNTTSMTLPLPTVATSNPKILYTDLLSGPISGGENGKGVYLSIFGRNFGSSGLGATVKVYIGGVEVDNYRYLGPSKVYGALGIQQITVQVGALGNPTLGTPLPIKVVVGGLSSNTDKTFTANPGSIYFVSLSGDDSTGAANDITHPYRHVQKSGINNNNYNLSNCPISAGDQAVSAAGVWGIVHPGDVIVMRGGVWTDVSAANSFLSVQNKSGTAPAGTSGTGPITVMGYPGEDVFINNVYTPGTYGAGIRSADSARQAIGCGAWMTFANLRVESGREEGVFNTEKGDANPSGSHWRVVNNEMTSSTAVNNPDAKGAGVSGGGAGNYWVGNYVHDIYDKADGVTDLENHGFYVQGDGPYEIAYNQIENIYGGNGINVYNPYGTSSYVNFHDNVIKGVAKHGLNIVNGAASGMTFYNNVVYDTDYYCLRLSSLNFSGAKIYNNTFYNCDIKGGGYNGAIVNDWQPLTSSMVTLYNNIVYPYSNRRYVSGTFGAGMFSNNLYYNGTDGLPANEPGQIVGNPSFVSLGTNLKLSAGSPAIDAGSSAVSSVVATDILNTSRPQGAGYDIGAYEKE